MTVKQYNELVAWQKAIDLVEEVYRIAQGFPREEQYGLVAQLRRAAVSAPSNIAEGQSRTSREFVHYLAIAHGSLSEVEIQMVIASRLGHIDKEQVSAFSRRAAEVGRLINGLARAVGKLATDHRPPATA